MAASEFLEFCGGHGEHRLCGFLLYSQRRFRCGPELFYNDGSEQSSIAGAGQWRERGDERGVHLWEQQPVPFEFVPGFELLGRRGVQYHSERDDVLAFAQRTQSAAYIQTLAATGGTSP